VRLAEFCLALPEDQYLRQGEPRSLIRRAMKSYLPLSVLTNHQRGLQAADWWERLIGAHERVEAELSYIEQCNLARQVLNLKLMRTMLEKMQSVQTNDGAALWDYQFIFQWGLMIGRFLCWFETSGR
jgi:asparagine synthase (glutamine-hydrolysing)